MLEVAAEEVFQGPAAVHRAVQVAVAMVEETAQV
jgi:hypothetical protein